MTYHQNVEKTGNNDNALVFEINKWGGLPATAAYCGTSIGFFAAKAKLKILGINKAEMPLAINWKKRQNIVWDTRNGWRTLQRKPNCDEIFVVLFRRKDGGSHVGVIVFYHGVFDFVTGQANTSNWRARQKTKADVEAVGTSLQFRQKNLMILPKTYSSGNMKGERHQGVFLKETYQQGNLIAIMKYKVAFVK